MGACESLGTSPDLKSDAMQWLYTLHHSKAQSMGHCILHNTQIHIEPYFCHKLTTAAVSCDREYH